MSNKKFLESINPERRDFLEKVTQGRIHHPGRNIRHDAQPEIETLYSERAEQRRGDSYTLIERF